MQRSKYTAEFKAEAVKQVVDKGQAFWRTREDLDGRQRQRICVQPAGGSSAGHSDLLR